MGTQNESCGMLEKWYVRAIKTFGAGNFPSLVCYVSSNSFLRSLAEDAVEGLNVITVLNVIKS